MSKDVSRRDFIKVASATAGAATIATGFNPLAYAANEKVNIAMIGTGGQGTYHIKEGLAHTPDSQIVAIADFYSAHQKSGMIFGQCSNAGIGFQAGEDPRNLPAAEMAKAKAALRPKGYHDYKEMLANEDIDAVVVATPLDTHHQIVMDCLDAGKYVLCEKTMTMTIEQARDIVKKCHETGKWVMVGHQRRYNPRYNLAVQLAYEAGELGRITNINAQWHRNSFWRRNYDVTYDQLPALDKQYITEGGLDRHLNWRMYNDRSGGLFTELATHQTDIANWFMRGVPTKVRAFGGLDYWRDGREADDNITIMYEYEQNPGDAGFMAMESRSVQQEKVAIRKKYNVRFAYSCTLSNAHMGTSELIQGDKGAIKITEDHFGDSAYFIEPWYAMEKKKAADAKAAEEAGLASGDGTEAKSNDMSSGASLMNIGKGSEGIRLLYTKKLLEANTYQHHALAHHIKNGGTPRTNQMVGLTTTIGAVAALESRKQDKTITVNPADYQFDFETPSFFEHDMNVDDYEDDPILVKEVEDKKAAAAAEAEAAAKEAEAAKA